MIPRRAALLTALALLLAAWPAGGQDGVIEVPLRERSLRELGDAPAVWLGWPKLSWDRIPGGARLDDYALPADVHQPLLTYAAFPGRPGTVIALLAASAPDEEQPDRLWLDWNDDRRFSTEEEVPLARRGEYHYFGPVEARSRDTTQRYLLFRHAPGELRKLPATYLEGVVTLGDQRVRLGFVDLSLDGEPDIALVDFDGDGRFMLEQEGSLWEQEAVRLGAPLQLPDGEFYRPRLTPDGSGVSLTRDAASRGTLWIDAPRFAALLRRDGDPLLARSSDGQLPLPAGEYDLVRLAVAYDEAPGRTWYFELLPPLAGGALRVSAGRSVARAAGPPLRLELEHRPPDVSDFGHDLMLIIRDRGDNVVTEIRRPGGGRETGPPVRIFTAAGELLAETSTEGYFALPATWEPPAGFTGEVKAVVDWQSPFGTLRAETTFFVPD